jgi:hypothetical protein
MRPKFVIVPLICSLAATPDVAATATRLVGRWDITIQDPRGAYPSWLEVLETEGTLVGRFVGRIGGARPVARLALSGGEVAFSVPLQFEPRRGDLVFNGRFNGSWMKGETTNDRGERVSWTAVRAPRHRRDRPVRWGKPVALLASPTLDDWIPRRKIPEPCWVVAQGVLSNRVPCTDLMTRRTFRDFRLQLDFKLDRGADSGIHLRGRHEIQLRDDDGLPPEPENGVTGSLYGFIAPSRRAAKGPGEWQQLDVTLVGDRLSVSLNGETVVDEQEVPGITGDALDSHEGRPGPIVLQGYLGQVSFRNIVVTPAL